MTFPGHLVVVLGLHHLIANTEDRLTANIFIFLIRRWIERCLQSSIQCNDPAVALSCGRQHLDLPERINFEKSRQPPADQVDNGLRGIGWHGLPLKEEVAPLCVHARHLSAVDEMRIVDNHALFILPEDLGKTHHGKFIAVDEITKHISRTDTGQLVDVTDHDEPHTGGHGIHRRTHQEDVHHGHLVDNQSAALERIVLIPLKAFNVRGIFKETMQRHGLLSACLAHPLGSAACRRCKEHLLPVQKTQNAFDNRGFAGSGAARNNRNAILHSGLDRKALLRMECDAFLPFHGINHSVGIQTRLFQFSGHQL